MSEQLEPLATEAGQQAIVRAINNLSSLEYAVRAEHAATAAAQSADDALTSATNASNSETKARDWAEKTNGAVETETIVTPPETEGDPPTEELVSYFSAKYWAQMAEDYFSQMTFDTVPTEDSTNGITSGAVYDALATKQNTLTFDNAPTQNSVNPVKSGGVYSALDTKADKSTTYTKTEVDTALGNVQGQLTFDSTPTANSNNPVTSGGIYTALQGVGTGDVTTNTDQNITGTKTFVGSKKVAFKQSTANDKLGFTLFGNTGTERGYLEFNPTNTVDGVTGLMTLGNYATSAAGLTQVGFRRYSSISGASGAYNLLMPMVSDARTPFSLTTTYQNFYLPLGFTDGTTTVKTAKSGVVDISSLLQNVSIDIDDEITEDSDNPVTSAAIYEALQNIEVTGGAGNASGVVIETIYTGNNSMLAVNDELNLLKSWKDYDVLEFVFFAKDNTLANNNPYGVTRFVTTKSIQNSYSTNQNFRIGLFINDLGSDSRMVTLRVPSETQFVVNTNGSNNQSLNIQYINGIKFSKNLSEQMYSNVLYENSSGWSSGSIILNDSLENYDFITLEGFLNGENPKNYFSDIFFLNTINHVGNNRFVVTRDANRYICFSITDYTQLTVTASSGYKIDRIVGHKMAKGGYSGIVSDARMTVKSGTVTMDSGVGSGSGVYKSVIFDSPMPDTNYIVQITPMNGTYGYASGAPCVTEKTVNGFKIYVWGNGGVRDPMIFDWVAIRPNSYTREGMVEDVLFSNASGVNSGTINLSGNISDYDLICFGLLQNGGGSYTQYDDYILTSNRIIEHTPASNTEIIITTMANYYVGLQYITDSSLQITSVRNSKVVKITGIKFGRYVGNVAIDSTVTQNGTGLVTSGAVYDALQNVAPSITIDSSVTQNGTNAVSGSAVYTAIQTALNSITNANGVSY